MSLRLIPYLVMDGNAQEAIDFYQKALEAMVVHVQTFGEMPENPDFPLPEAAKNLIAHAMLKVGQSELMFSDTFPGQPVHKGNHVTICISTNDIEKSRKIFGALEEGGQVEMPLQETFWSPLYGIVVDQYGVTFQISTSQ